MTRTPLNTDRSAAVQVYRGSVLESVHRVHVVVVDAGGGLQFLSGSDVRPTFMRSAAKPFQALPLVEDGVADRLGLSDEALAVCCGSHNSEPRHLQAVRSILAAARLDDGALECGPHPPLRREVGHALARAGQELTAIHSNCSGKHAGMLALSVDKGWPTAGYNEPDHPVQERMRSEMKRWTSLDDGQIEEGIDGCGVVCFALPLREMALAYARFGSAAVAGDPGPRRIAGAMREHAFFVAGTGRLCTDLMTATGGRVIAKVGADGVYCAAIPGAELGLALKVEDGGRRAAEVALLDVLTHLGCLDAEVRQGPLARYGSGAVLNTRREVVGRIEVTLGGDAAS